MTAYGSAVGACPDPAQFEQLVAATLSEDARGAMLDHAASCAECHAVMTVLVAFRQVPAIARAEQVKIAARRAFHPAPADDPR